MITITKEFTKEQLQQIEAAAKEVMWPVVWSEKKAREHFSEKITPKVVLKLARIALASLEAEPVAYIRDGFRADGVHFCGGIITAEEHERTKPALSDRYTWKHQPLYTAPPASVSVPDGYRLQPISEYDAMCAAMLQGAEPVTTAYKLPDGWVAVPIEPTAEMISSGIAAHFERSQTQIHDRPAPGPMECAYVAMLAAAPQQEANNG